MTLKLDWIILPKDTTSAVTNFDLEWLNFKCEVTQTNFVDFFLEEIIQRTNVSLTGVGSENSLALTWLDLPCLPLKMKWLLLNTCVHLISPLLSGSLSPHLPVIHLLLYSVLTTVPDSWRCLLSAHPLFYRPKGQDPEEQRIKYFSSFQSPVS